MIFFYASYFLGFEIHDLHHFNYFLLFSQVPVVPLQRPDEIHIPSPSWMQTSSGFEDMSCEQAVPTMITWTYGGKEVAVEGSWDNWKIRFVEKNKFPTNSYVKFELYD